MPTCLHFSSQNPSISHQNSILEGVIFLIDFYIDFMSILARLWKPTWSHVGHIFLQNGARGLSSPLFFVGSMLFFDFVVVLAYSWPHFGSILEGPGSIFEGFGRRKRCLRAVSGWQTLCHRLVLHHWAIRSRKVAEMLPSHRTSALNAYASVSWRRWARIHGVGGRRCPPPRGLSIKSAAPP